MEASWVVLERREAEKARMPKSFKNQWKINEFCLLGTSRAVLERRKAEKARTGKSADPVGVWTHVGVRSVVASVVLFPCVSVVPFPCALLKPASERKP